MRSRKGRTKHICGLWANAARGWLLILFLSTLGWLWETVYTLLWFHRLSDRGFLALPICPIYGFTIMGFYGLFGTPHRGRYAMKRIRPAFLRYVVYLLLAFVVPTAMELAVGVIFHKTWGVRLWDYSARPLNMNGYISLPISLIWSLALTLFMRFLFLPLHGFFQSAKTKPAVIIAVLSGILVATDFIYNLTLLFTA